MTLVDRAASLSVWLSRCSHLLSQKIASISRCNTGWDANNNQGRGYIQGRFRSKNLMYAETEYRFGILRNGLLGGVAFVNTHLASEPITGQLARLFPAGGAGLRLKLNKRSNVNLAVDYALGLDGSRSLYFNIGELF